MPTILLVYGKVNFTNLGRYSGFCEKTYRRQYCQPFAFVELNQHTIIQAIPARVESIAAMDCSFLPKSGKGSYGLDWFYNGNANRSEKGLEISVIAVIDVVNHRGYTLSAVQTPATPIPVAQQRQEQTISHPVIEQLADALKQLPQKPPPQTPDPVLEPTLTRIDHYLSQLQAARPYFPTQVNYLVADGFYSKRKFADGVVALDLHLISKLRVDAHLRYLYTGSQKPKGRHRQSDGKVDLTNLSRFTLVETLAPHLHLYTAVVWSASLKRKLRLALLVDTHNPNKTGYVLLFSTDVDLNAQQILTYYKARFQIEFIFRDAKQFTGLCDAQTRDAKKLDFHFNANLSALNLAKYDDHQRRSQPDSDQSASSFSMASYKRVAFNDHLMERFISQLDLDSTSIKSHPNYQNLRSYGIITS